MEVIAVFQSSPENISKYVGKQNPPFVLLADPEEKLYKLFGLQSRWSGYFSFGNLTKGFQSMMKGYLPGKLEGDIARIPGDFLLDENMLIQEIYQGKDIGDHIPFEHVWKFIKP